jgi:hypothetical protein
LGAGEQNQCCARVSLTAVDPILLVESRRLLRPHPLPSHSLPRSVIFLRLLFFTNEWRAPLRAEDECLHA